VNVTVEVSDLILGGYVTTGEHYHNNDVRIPHIGKDKASLAYPKQPSLRKSFPKRPSGL